MEFGECERDKLCLEIIIYTVMAKSMETISKNLGNLNYKDRNFIFCSIWSLFSKDICCTLTGWRKKIAGNILPVSLKYFEWLVLVWHRMLLNFSVQVTPETVYWIFDTFGQTLIFFVFLYTFCYYSKYLKFTSMVISNISGLQLNPCF